MDFSTYQSPGVFTEQIPGPLVGVQASTPTSVGFFGLGRGYRIDLETIVIPADFYNDEDQSYTPVATQSLRQQGINTATIRVANSGSGVVYTPQTSPPNGDYEIIVTNGPSGVSHGPDSTVTLKRVISSTLGGASLTDEISIQVSYQYADASYFEPQKFYDYDDVVDFYGSPFDSNGAIISPLTLCCNLAFRNGARTVIAVAVASAAQTNDYVAALDKLAGIGEISVIVPAVSNTSVFAAVKDHVVLQSTLKNERRAIVGLDGSVTAVSSSARIIAARALNSSRVALVAPSTVSYYNSQIAQVQSLGSQYVAAALAGIAVTQNPAQPLTRKSVAGFVGIPTASESQKNQESAAGLLVVESASGAALRVRHGVTTNPATLLTREWSITGQQDAMAYRLRQYFENGGIIGGLLTDVTLANVKASAATALQSLVSDGIIQRYNALKVRQQLQNLDVIEVSYEWQPSLPLNYILVRFTIDVSSGTVADTTTSL